MDFPFSTERKDFPVLEQTVQLTSCSQSACSRRVADAVGAYLGSWQQSGMDWGRWMEELDAAKRAFASLINARPDEVAAVSSVSHAVSALASALDFEEPRREVVLTHMDFPTLGHLWRRQEARGAVLRLVDWDGGPLTADTLRPHVSDATRVVSIPHQAYYNGARADLAGIGELARSHGALCFVDAYQSLGTTSVDVRALPVDALAAGMQKYLLGTPGIAFLYVRRELAEQLRPTVTGWFGQADPFAFDIATDRPAEGARRFEAGTPAVVNAYAARAALEHLLEVGIDRIERYLTELTASGLDAARDRGLELATPVAPGHVGPNIAVRVGDAHAMEDRLRGEGLLVSARSDVVRIAPHFYNRPGDLTEALDAVRSHL